MAIDLLKDLTKFNITDIEFEDLKNIENSTGYEFSTIKLKALILNDKSEKNETNNSVTKVLYIKMIRKDRIKESIFCYWSLLYEEMFKNFEESEFTSIINKVRIKETQSEENKHSILLEIEENKWKTLEYGSTIHLVKLWKYLNDETIKKSKLTTQWKKYLEQENHDVLFIGIIN